MFYDYLLNSLGEVSAKQYLKANEEAIKNIEKIIQEEKIDCDFEKQDNYVFTQSKQDVKKIKAEVEAVNSIGFNAEYLEKINIPIKIKEKSENKKVENKWQEIDISKPVLAAIKFPNQAQFNSYKYILGLVKKIEQNNGKIYENSKILGKYNLILDGTRFQKAHYEVSKEWLSQEKEGKTTWYISMLELKLVANSMAVSLMNEMIKNDDKLKANETEKNYRFKSEDEVKQDCELNATKRLLPQFRRLYPRLPARVIADSLYPSIELMRICEKLMLEYIFVLKDKKTPTLTREFLDLVSLSDGNRYLQENEKEIILTMWVNDIDYQGMKTNIIRQIRKNKQDEKYSIWMWMTNRKITQKNVNKIIYCARLRDYIENQGFREQKVTSGIDLEHVYSKNINAINVIYTIIQITHLILQIIEHSDICGDFSKKYGSVKVFRRKFYAHLSENDINIELIQTKIQIRFDKSLMIY